jgi:conjugative transfer signal peptidase TraF
VNGRRFGLIAWAAGATIIAAGAWADSAGLRLNTTASLPRGLWQVVGRLDTMRVGDVVAFCPPLTGPILQARQRGYVGGGTCPGDVEPMMKPVVAREGDRVAISAFGVIVNGRLVPNSAPMPTDGAGRALPVVKEVEAMVPTGVVWVVSSHNSRSYDSRYFGPIARESVTAVLRPLWTEASR